MSTCFNTAKTELVIGCHRALVVMMLFWQQGNQHVYLVVRVVDLQNMCELNAEYMLQVTSAHFLAPRVKRLRNTFDRSSDAIVGVQLNHLTEIIQIIIVPAPLVLLVYKQSLNLTSDLNRHLFPFTRIQTGEVAVKPHHL